MGTTRFDNPIKICGNHLENERNEEGDSNRPKVLSLRTRDEGWFAGKRLSVALPIQGADAS